MNNVWSDYGDIVRRWRVWWIMGMQDVRLRYRRSVLGPFWISMSLGAMVIGIALMYSQVFDIGFATYLAFLGCGFLCWNFISAMILDGSQMLVDSEQLLKSSNLSVPTLAARMVQRNVGIFLHNLIVIALLLAFSGLRPEKALLFLPIGVLTVMLAGFGFATILGPLCLRFRDAGQLVTSLTQILFFITPILWIPSQGRLNSVWIDINPVYHLIELIRCPLLGSFPTQMNMLVAGGLTVSLLLAGFATTAHTRRKIFVWL